MDPRLSVFPFCVFRGYPLVQVFFILSPQTFSSTASLSRVGVNINNQFRFIKLIPLLVFPPLSLLLLFSSRPCPYQETKLRQCGWSQHFSGGQQGAKPSQSGLPVPAYVYTPHKRSESLQSHFTHSASHSNDCPICHSHIKV